ncbi:MAG TPA: ABC transporter permease [Terriglobales bacterium]|nr:ABC transporter permease [Terriglobales bacterium]
MDENGVSTVSLPRRLRVEAVPAAFREIQARRDEGPVTVDFSAVEEFDSSALALLSYLRGCVADVRVTNVGGALERSARAFLGGTSPPSCEVPEPGFDVRVLHPLSDRFLARMRRLGQFFVLLSDEIYHTGDYLRRRKGVYPGEIWNQLFFMGYKSFPITCGLMFLIGVTIAKSASYELHLFGADIYMADLIGYSMLRELVPLMTGIILAGKVGAAVAAELSTMSVLEEVDALKTMGIVPERFLMVPRLIAMTLAVPLLVALADVVGITGGVIVSRMSFGILPSAFIREMRTAVDLKDFWIGLEKSLVFGWAIIIGSGYKGLTVGRSAGEVGRATTESVVLSVILIVIIDCIFALITY